MRVLFTKDFDWRASRNVTLAFKAGTEQTVKRECGEAAIAAGKAQMVESDSEQSQDK